MEMSVHCPYAEKSDTLILCSHDPEATGARSAWRARDTGKIITMPFFCLNKCAFYKEHRQEKSADKRPRQR